MINYVIGIIDDDPINVLDIKRVFLRYAKLNGCKFEFKSFYLDNNQLSFEDIFKNIISSIRDQGIDCLIVDYKLIFTQETNKGAEIINEIRKIIPEFPCVILTGREEECLKEANVDPDKIYKKTEFLKISQPVSELLLKKILLNIERVRTSIKKLKEEIDVLKAILTTSNKEEDSETVARIIGLEAELDKYCMLGQSELDKVYDATSLENIVALIEKVKKII